MWSRTEGNRLTAISNTISELHSDNWMERTDSAEAYLAVGDRLEDHPEQRDTAIQTRRITSMVSSRLRP